jgi:hypothetical protein
MSQPPHGSKPTRERDPLAPLDTLVGWLFALVVAFVLFGTAITTLHAFGKHENASVLAFSNDVCVDAGSFLTGDISGSSRDDLVKPGSRVQPTGTTFCTKDPSWALQFAASTGALLGLALALGACLLARQVIRSARRDGLFTTSAASWMRALGWFLIAGSVVISVGAEIGNGIFIAAAAAPETGLTWSSELRSVPGLDWTSLILGVCAITAGRVIRRGVSLQQDVDLTV